MTGHFCMVDRTAENEGMVPAVTLTEPADGLDSAMRGIMVRGEPGTQVLLDPRCVVYAQDGAGAMAIRYHPRREPYLLGEWARAWLAMHPRWAPGGIARGPVLWLPGGNGRRPS